MRRHRVRLPLFAFIAAVPLALAAVAPANAVPVRYADNPVVTYNIGASPSFSQAAQTFTAKATGRLQSVAISMYTYQAETTTMSLWTEQGGLPGALISTSGAVATKAGGGKTFTFSGVTVTQGTKYVFVVDVPVSDTVITVSNGNAYTGGDELLNQVGVGWVTSTAFDWTFSTVIDDSRTLPTMTGTAPTASEGIASTYTYALGGSPLPTVSLAGGDLPTGLSISAAGVLSGTPTVPGTFTFTLRADNLTTTVDGASTAVLLPQTMTVRAARPDAPTLTATDPGVRSVTVGFAAPAYTGTSAITAYRVTASNGAFCTTAAPGSCVVSGLGNGAALSYTVAVMNASGWSAESGAVSATTWPLPAVPVAVITGGDSKVDLEWAAPSTGAGPAPTSYTVEYRQQGALSWDSRSVSARTTSFTGLQNGQSYEFRVSATNAVGSGPTSVTTAVIPGRAPGAVQSTTGVGGDGYVDLSWVPSSDNGGYLASYEVQHRASGATTWGPTASTGGTTMRIDSLANGTGYEFQARGVNSKGAGAWGPIATATPGAAPSMPLTPTADRSDESVTVRWTAPASTGGFAVTGYLLEQRLGAGSWTPVGTETESSRSRIVSGLENGTTYSFRVAAVNARGTSDWVTVSATPGAVTSAPIDVTSITGDSAVLYGWTAPVDLGGFVVDTYESRFRAVGGTWGAPIDVGLATSTTFSALDNGTAYEFQVRAVNEVGAGVWSTTVSATPGTAPGVPVAPTAERADSSVVVGWSAPAVTGGFSVTGYVLEQRAGTGPWTPAGSVLESIRTFTVTGLENGVAHSFRVAATNARGTGDWVIVAGTPGAVTSAPRSVTGTAGDGAVEFTWTAPADLGGFPVDAYESRIREADGTWPSAGHTALATSTTVTGLDNGTDYEFQVRAINDVGASAWADAVVATPFTLPSAPVSVATTSLPGEVELDWAVPAGNGRPVTAYLVEHRLAGAIAWGTPTTVTEPAATVTGLVNGVEVEFRISALNEAGTGAPSLVVAETPADVATAPVDLLVTQGDGTLDLAWGEPADLGGFPAFGYEAEYRLAGEPLWRAVQPVGSTATITELANASAYEVRVRAVTAIGEGAWATGTGTPFVFAPRFLDADGRALSGATIAPGQRVTLEGSGALPGEIVQLVMYSTPVVLGSTTVAADGTYSVTASIPMTADAGSHRLVATLGGNMAAAEVGLSVVRPAALASTGADVAAPVLGAALLLVLGMLLLARGRRARAGRHGDGRIGAM